MYKRHEQPEYKNINNPFPLARVVIQQVPVKQHGYKTQIGKREVRPHSYYLGAEHVDKTSKQYSYKRTYTEPLREMSTFIAANAWCASSFVNQPSMVDIAGCPSA